MQQVADWLEKPGLGQYAERKLNDADLKNSASPRLAKTGSRIRTLHLATPGVLVC